MEILPTETCQGENDSQKVQRLDAKLVDGAQKTEFFFSSPCIYRVPKELRKLKEIAYTPRLVAIGPLHKDHPHLQTPMQHVKRSCANNLLRRLTEGIVDLELAKQKKLTVLGDCMAAMEMSIEDAKKCYPEEVTLDVEMMVIDGCFILEFLFRHGGGAVPRNSEGVPAADPIFSNSLTRITVQHDLLLLENQIPYLVLEKLFPLTLAQIHNRPDKNLSLTEYVFLLLPTIFCEMRPAGGNSTNNGCPITPCSPGDSVLLISVSSEEEVPSITKKMANNYHHILHKLHHAYLSDDLLNFEVKFVGDKFVGEKKEFNEIMPSASELDYAGVKFVPGTGNDQFNFKVQFTEPKGLFWGCRRARFEIPILDLDDSAESVLRNLIAFEQCCPGISQHFTSYAKLMDMLVNSDKDVQVLEKAGVVRNRLGATRDASNLFNKLSKEVVIGEFFFAHACDSATRYSERFLPKNMAYVRRKYFASPWTSIAFCLGFLAFGITITQFILSFIKEERYKY